MRTIHDPRYIRLVECLRQRRRQLRLTQNEVAARLGWRRTVLTNTESRERRLDILELASLCTLYEIRFTEVEAILRGQRGEP